ncbi:MAG: protein kinase [Pirellulaceae bacterium]
MNKSDIPETIELRIAEVVSEWMESAADDRLNASTLIEQYPELAPGLAECLRGLECVEQGKLSRDDLRMEEHEVADQELGLPVIPDFQILSELGRGGMGVVYEAKQLSLDRVVALKVLPFGAVDSRTVKRFLREAETVASLTHPHIVPIYSVGVDGGLNWYAMQRIDGCPLSHWFAVSTLSSRAETQRSSTVPVENQGIAVSTFSSRAETLDEVVRAGIEAAEALAHAHQQGVIHRDVKPGNLLIDTHGKVWLTDFGLARRDVDVTATATGSMLGTPRYMSPEQIAGHDEEIDARTDIYSLGATLYEMATGRPPFTSESPLELLTQIQRDEPTPPRRIDPGIPRTLELVILKCLDKEPDRRYHSAATVAADLKAIRDDKPITARGLPAWVRASRFVKRNQRQVHAIATSVLITLLTLVAAALLWQQSEQASRGDLRITTPAGLYIANIQPRTLPENEPPDDVPATRSDVIGHPSRVRIDKEPVKSTLVTTPMQQPMTLPAGEYDVRLEGVGKPSQTVDVVVKPQALTEIDYVDRRESMPEVDIHRKRAVPMSDGSLAVLGKDAFAVFDPRHRSRRGSNPVRPEAGATHPSKIDDKSPSRMLRFSVPITELDATLAEEASAARPANVSDRDDSTLTFAFDAEQPFQGDFNVIESSFARMERVFSDRIDLDGDDEGDYLVTAARHAAIAAISSEGVILWKRRLPMQFEIAEAPSRYPRKGMANEAIVGIHRIEDLDDDATDDLVINAALFDPSGYSRPYIFTISGRDGGVLSVAPLATIDMRKTPHWAWAGLMRYHREFNSDLRFYRPVATHFGLVALRSQSHNFNNDSWGGNSANSALYVLPPLMLERHEGERVAITATNNAVTFISLSDGTKVSPDIVLGQPILRGPKPVRLANGDLGAIVLTGIPSSAYTRCLLELCVLGESQPRWSWPQNIGASDFVAGAADTSFPMAIDLDGDGNDEIISPTNSDVPFKWPQLHCYSHDVGSLLWTSTGVAGISRTIDQALPVGDINGDGFIDLIVVGLAQLLNGQANGQSGSSNDGGLRLAIDFLSGRKGNRIGYREEIVATGFQEFQVAEIDHVELVGHELICSVVYGAREELNLSSVTLTIDLSRLEPSIVARGLTALAKRGGQASTGQGAWYRRRSGPYANPSDAAVWVEKDETQSTYPGETLIASWLSSGQRPRVLLGRSDGTARCIDPLNGDTVWVPKPFRFNGNQMLVLPGNGENVDLICDVQVTGDTVPTFIDAETGRARFAIETPRMDAIRLAWPDRQSPEQFVYALAGADSSRTPGSAGQREQGYLLMKIDRVEGRLVWWRKCYQGVKQQYSHLRPTDPIQVDINGDQVNDLITGGTDNTNLIVQAIDGRDASVLWELPLNLTIDDWPWNEPWPMMSLVAGRTEKLLLVIDGVVKDDHACDLKSIRISDGSQLDAVRHRVGSPLRYVTQSNGLSVNMVSTENSHGIIDLSAYFPADKLPPNAEDARRSGQAFGRLILNVDAGTGKFQEGSLFESAPIHFPVDIDHDQIMERVEVQSNTVQVRHGKTNELISEFEIPKDGGSHRIDSVANKPYLVVAFNNNIHQWFELPGGRVALRFGQGMQSIRLGETQYPRLLAHGNGTTLVGSSLEATICAQVNLGSTTAEPVPLRSMPVAMHAPELSPRYRTAVTAHGMFQRKSLADVARLALLTLGGLMLPAGYTYRLIRYRRWSLKTILFAPAVGMFALVSWRSLQDADVGTNVTIDVIAGLMVALTVWAIINIMRHQRWKALLTGMAVSMLLATLFMLGAGESIERRLPGVVGYWTFSAWLTAVLAAATQIVMPVGFGIMWAQDKARRNG